MPDDRVSGSSNPQAGAPESMLSVGFGDQAERPLRAASHFRFGSRLCGNAANARRRGDSRACNLGGGASRAVKWEMQTGEELLIALRKSLDHRLHQLRTRAVTRSEARADRELSLTPCLSINSVALVVVGEQMMLSLKSRSRDAYMEA